MPHTRTEYSKVLQLLDKCASSLCRRFCRFCTATWKEWKLEFCCDPQTYPGALHHLAPAYVLASGVTSQHLFSCLHTTLNAFSLVWASYPPFSAHPLMLRCSLSPSLTLSHPPLFTSTNETSFFDPNSAVRGMIIHFFVLGPMLKWKRVGQTWRIEHFNSSMQCTLDQWLPNFTLSSCKVKCVYTLFGSYWF